MTWVSIIRHKPIQRIMTMKPPAKVSAPHYLVKFRVIKHNPHIKSASNQQSDLGA
mgnify:FL=1